MVVNLGVISALVLSLTIGLNFSVSSDEFAVHHFKNEVGVFTNAEFQMTPKILDRSSSESVPD